MKFLKKSILYIVIYSSIISAILFAIVNLLFYTIRDVPYAGVTQILIKYNTNLISFLLAIILIIIIYKISKLKIYIKPIYIFILSVFCALAITPFGIIHDSYSILTVANELAHNRPIASHFIIYVQTYPFLFGLAAFEEIIIRLFHCEITTACFVLDIIFAYFMILIYIYLYKITTILFNKKTSYIFSLLFIGCAHLLLRTNYIYGLIPMLCFSTIAIYYIMLYIKTYSNKYAFLSILMITISEVFKPNTLIFIVGILIILLYNLLNKFTLKKLIFIILFSTIPFIIAAIPPIYYQHRTGLNLLNPPPEIVHVEMGLSSTETIVEGIVTGDKVMSYGWYNGATNDSANSTVENDAEYIKTNNVIKIKQHINHFINNPKYTLDFFGKKYISQWGSNDFSVFGQYFGNKTSVMSSFARSVVEGSGYKLLQIYMQAYKLIIAVFTLVALIILSKSKKIIVFLIPFIIAGAAAFYQISEGKDEYVMPFFVLMLPYAAYGLNRFFIKVEKRLNLKTYN